MTDVVFYVLAALNIAGLSCGAVVLIRHRNRLYNGVATRAVARRLKCTPLRFRRRLNHVTVLALVASWPFAWTFALALNGPMIIMAIGWALGDLDDYFTGDDRWQRRWQAIRNRIRWRMTLSAPARANPGTA